MSNYVHCGCCGSCHLRYHGVPEVGTAREEGPERMGEPHVAQSEQLASCEFYCTSNTPIKNKNGAEVVPVNYQTR